MAPASRVLPISGIRCATLGLIPMIDRNDFDGLIRETDINDPAFLEHMQMQFANDQFVPDDEDLDLSADVSTRSRAKTAYRMAQARKLARMYRDWKAAGN
jgi:hypothetical protein